MHQRTITLLTLFKRKEELKICRRNFSFSTWDFCWNCFIPFTSSKYFRLICVTFFCFESIYFHVISTSKFDKNRWKNCNKQLHNILRSLLIYQTPQWTNYLWSAILKTPRCCFCFYSTLVKFSFVWVSIRVETVDFLNKSECV